MAEADAYLGYRDDLGRKTSPTDKQREVESQFFDSDKLWFLLHGGKGGAKTSCAIQVGVIKQMLRTPGLHTCLGHIDYQSLESSLLYHLFKQLGRDPIRVINGKKFRIWERKSALRKVIVRLPGMIHPYHDFTASIDYRPLDPTKGLDEKLGTVGAEYGTFIWDQCERGGTIAVHHSILSRVRLLPGKTIYTANPDERSWHVPLWVNPDPTKVNQMEKYCAILMNPYDNPHLSPDYIPNLKAQYSEALWQRYLEGSYVPIEGLILNYNYDNMFDPINRAPSTWMIFESIDYGFKDPCVVQWWGVDPNGHVWLFDSIKRRGAPAEDVAREMLAIRKNWLTGGHQPGEGPRYVRSPCDPSMGSPRDGGIKSLLVQFRESGVHLRPSIMHKVGKEGQIKSQISLLVKLNSSGKLHISRDQDNWVKEERVWTWERKGRERPTEFRSYEADGHTVEHHFDYMAAMRYFVGDYFGTTENILADGTAAIVPDKAVVVPDYRDAGLPRDGSTDIVSFYTRMLYGN